MFKFLTKKQSEKTDAAREGLKLQRAVLQAHIARLKKIAEDQGKAVSNEH